jgi:hypothetical protein
MDAKGGYKSVENLRAAGNQHGRMFIVPNSGHHGERRCGHAPSPKLMRTSTQCTWTTRKRSTTCS